MLLLDIDVCVSSLLLLNKLPPKFGASKPIDLLPDAPVGQKCALGLAGGSSVGAPRVTYAAGDRPPVTGGGCGPFLGPSLHAVGHAPSKRLVYKQRESISHTSTVS